MSGTGILDLLNQPGVSWFRDFSSLIVYSISTKITQLHPNYFSSFDQTWKSQFFFYSMSSSSQDEIIEISSSPPSLESFQTTPRQNVPSISSLSSLNSVSEKRNDHYLNLANVISQNDCRILVFRHFYENVKVILQKHYVAFVMFNFLL